MLSHRRLRVAFALAFCTLLLTAVACDSTPSGSASSATSAATSAASSKTASSSAETSSAESQASSAQTLPETDERGYVLVANAVKKRDLAVAVADVSEVFDAAAPGYVVEGGPYLVNADTLKRLTTAKVEGSGSVKYVDFKVLRMDYDTDDPFTGEIPVSKLHDPVYVQMNLPSEAQTFMSSRVNPENMHVARADHKNVLPIGAVYRNENNKPADTDVFTICIRNIRCFIHTQEKGWITTNDIAVPTESMVNHVYNLPWIAENGSWTVPSDRIQVMEDHVEITLTGEDLNGKFKESRPKVEESCLHFWGKQDRFSNHGVTGDQIDGVIAAYDIWVKEPEAVGKIVATIGADWRVTSNGKTDQAFSGYNHLITTEPRTVYGHNVGPKAYDSVVKSDEVMALLGMK